jgi:hypothetical protein
MNNYKALLREPRFRTGHFLSSLLISLYRVAFTACQRTAAWPRATLYIHYLSRARVICKWAPEWIEDRIRPIAGAHEAQRVACLPGARIRR